MRSAVPVESKMEQKSAVKPSRSPLDKHALFPYFAFYVPVAGWCNEPRAIGGAGEPGSPPA